MVIGIATLLTCTLLSPSANSGAAVSVSTVLDTGIGNGYGLTFDSSGNLYYSSINGTLGTGGDDSGFVGKLSFDTNGLVNSNTAFLNSGLHNPFALAYANGNLFVDEWSGNGCTNTFVSLKLYNVATKAGSCLSITGAPGSTDADLRGISIAPSGGFDLALGGNGGISEYTPSGSGYSGVFIDPVGQDHPFGVTWCAGNLYMADNGTSSANGSIKEFVGSIGNGTFQTIAPNLSYPSALVCGPDNNLYATLENSPDAGVDNGGSILKVELGSSPSTSTVLSSGLHSPQGLSFNSSGDLFVINGNGGSNCVGGMCGSIVKLANLVTTSTTTTTSIIYSKPTAPSNVSASMSNGTAVVSFTPGSTGNLATYNEIDMFENGQPVGNVCNVSVATSCPISNLGPTASFSFTVTAINAKGSATSPLSNAVSNASPATVNSTTTSTTMPPAKKTITCVKGKITKQLTAVKPTCPVGYLKK